MNKAEEIIKKESELVQRMFRHWTDYMEREVVFWDIPGGPEIHAQNHCERVLLHALRIGEAQGLPLRSLTALAHAAIFHDTRRKDNYLDVGHGGRAAKYYKEHCEHTRLEFLPEAYAAMMYHDRDDSLGDSYIMREGKGEATRWLTVYHDFKDADALDRLRLGTWCLDEKYLRSQEAKGMVGYAQWLVEQTTNPVALKRVYDMMMPFRKPFAQEGGGDS